MKKPNHQGKVLKDHKKVGKKLIPPMLQLPRMQETSFIEQTLPCLIWISALYKRCDGRIATKTVIDFIKDAESSIEGTKFHSLNFLGNFTILSNKQKNKIYSEVKSKPYFETLLDNLEHQYHLLGDYPLDFLFSEHTYALERTEAVEMLQEDVSALLNRGSIHATKVQVTAVFATMVTGKLRISNKMELPDFDKVFTEPNSDEAKHAASFARSNLNGVAGMFHMDSNRSDIKSNSWAKDFWHAAYSLKECTSEY